LVFDDANQISDYAATAVQTLANAGIISGVSDTEFAPQDNATRAQAAVILYTTFVK
jgi:pullulanase